MAHTHSHPQDHGHGHHRGHAHAHGGVHDHGGNERRVFWAALLTGGFMLAEVMGGLLAGSLALLADAAHMLTDAVALGLAWLAFRIGRRPADWRRTYGFDRFQIVAAFTNGVVLFLVALWILVEAVGRLLEPGPVLGGMLLVVAAAGLVVNLAVFAILHGGDRTSLNIRGALLHVLGDLLGSVAAIVAGVVILATGWTPIDPILSVLVGLLVLRSAWRLVAGCGHILLEGAPAGVDAREIGPDIMANVPNVSDVHHVHVWSLSERKRMVTLHARLGDPGPPDGTLTAIKQRLHERFGIGHATVEVEHGPCTDQRPC